MGPWARWDRNGIGWDRAGGNILDDGESSCFVRQRKEGSAGVKGQLNLPAYRTVNGVGMGGECWPRDDGG